MRVLVAGATGAIGRQLVPQLLAAGHQVSATTRTAAKADGLRAAGAEPYLLEALDEAAVGEVVARAEPEVIVHEMTSIPAKMNFRKFAQTFAPTNALRTTAVDNLLAAAKAQGVRRFVAQSYAGWSSARTGSQVKSETDPLDQQPPAAIEPMISAVKYLERAVTSAPLEGLALRYGNLYGPGASDAFLHLLRARQVPLVGSAAGVWSWLQIADAAAATVAAVGGGAPGIYNIVDDEPGTVADWLPVLARGAGAKPPMHVPGWLGRLAAGEAGFMMMTQVRGYSNAKAKRDLGWQPIWPTWREAFTRGGLTQVYPDGYPAARATGAP
ncbi:MAG TPA: NAD(P)-dependent oxidoreductase [Streptosporangiaceae bacterium]|jgi:nucleoside-diphosphate-sugar epimerase